MPNGVYTTVCVIRTARIGDVVLVAALAAEHFVAVAAIVHLRIEVLLLVRRQNGHPRECFLAHAASQ